MIKVERTQFMNELLLEVLNIALLDLDLSGDMPIPQEFDHMIQRRKNDAQGFVVRQSSCATVTTF